MLSKQANLEFELGEAYAKMMRKSLHLSPTMLEKLHAPKYTVKDTGFTYRQINYLGERQILPDERSSESAWRRFSMKELIFLSVIQDLRLYGITEDLLFKLRDAFFSKKSMRMTDIAIFTAMAGEKIHIVIDSEGKVGFYDISMYWWAHGKSRSHVDINLNETIGSIWERHEGERLTYSGEIRHMQEALGHYQISKKEAEIIRLIREQKFKSIDVRRTDNGEDFIITTSSDNAVKREEIQSLIERKQYATITVKKRDGTVVHVKVEETKKI